jgi:hypothetical protein
LGFLAQEQIISVESSTISRTWRAELRGKDLGDADGLVHRVAREIARSIRWNARRTG